MSSAIIDSHKQAILLEIARMLLENKQDILQRYLPKGCCGHSRQPEYVWANQSCYKLGKLVEANASWISTTGTE